MKKITIEATLSPPPDRLEIINNGLHEFNLKHLGQDMIYNYFKVAVVAKDGKGNVIGGIHGDLIWEWLHIDTLWVDENFRKQGIGSRLLGAMEAEALRKGFLGSHLETTYFQAVDFYQKNGYEIFGKLEGKPTGHTWFYMKKRLFSGNPTALNCWTRSVGGQRPYF